MLFMVNHYAVYRVTSRPLCDTGSLILVDLKFFPKKNYSNFTKNPNWKENKSNFENYRRYESLFRKETKNFFQSEISSFPKNRRNPKFVTEKSRRTKMQSISRKKTIRKFLPRLHPKTKTFECLLETSCIFSKPRFFSKNQIKTPDVFRNYQNFQNAYKPQ